MNIIIQSTLGALFITTLFSISILLFNLVLIYFDSSERIYYKKSTGFILISIIIFMIALQIFMYNYKF